MKHFFRFETIIIATFIFVLFILMYAFFPREAESAWVDEIAAYQRWVLEHPEIEHASWCPYLSASNQVGKFADETLEHFVVRMEKAMIRYALVNDTSVSVISTVDLRRLINEIYDMKMRVEYFKSMVKK